MSEVETKPLSRPVLPPGVSPEMLGEEDRQMWMLGMREFIRLGGQVTDEEVEIAVRILRGDRAAAKPTSKGKGKAVVGPQMTMEALDKALGF